MIVLGLGGDLHCKRSFCSLSSRIYYHMTKKNFCRAIHMIVIIHVLSNGLNTWHCHRCMDDTVPDTRHCKVRLRACNNLPQPNPYISCFNPPCSATVFDTVSSLHPTVLLHISLLSSHTYVSSTLSCGALTTFWQFNRISRRHSLTLTQTPHAGGPCYPISLMHVRRLCI